MNRRAPSNIVGAPVVRRIHPQRRESLWGQVRPRRRSTNAARPRVAPGGAVARTTARAGDDVGIGHARALPRASALRRKPPAFWGPAGAVARGHEGKVDDVVEEEVTYGTYCRHERTGEQVTMRRLRHFPVRGAPRPSDEVAAVDGRGHGAHGRDAVVGGGGLNSAGAHPARREATLFVGEEPPRLRKAPLARDAAAASSSGSTAATGERKQFGAARSEQGGQSTCANRDRVLALLTATVRSQPAARHGGGDGGADEQAHRPGDGAAADEDDGGRASSPPHWETILEELERDVSDQHLSLVRLNLLPP